MYVFCLDVSHGAVATGYLKVFCDTLLGMYLLKNWKKYKKNSWNCHNFKHYLVFIDELEKLPGDSRTQIGFITYDRVVHFYSMPEGKTSF